MERKRVTELLKRLDEIFPQVSDFDYRTIKSKELWKKATQLISDMNQMEKIRSLEGDEHETVCEFIYRYCDEIFDIYDHHDDEMFEDFDNIDLFSYIYEFENDKISKSQTSFYVKYKTTIMKSLLEFLICDYESAQSMNLIGIPKYEYSDQVFNEYPPYFATLDELEKILDAENIENYINKSLTITELSGLEGVDESKAIGKLGYWIGTDIIDRFGINYIDNSIDIDNYEYIREETENIIKRLILFLKQNPNEEEVKAFIKYNSKILVEYIKEITYIPLMIRRKKENSINEDETEIYREIIEFVRKHPKKVGEKKKEPKQINSNTNEHKYTNIEIQNMIDKYFPQTTDTDFNYIRESYYSPRSQYTGFGDRLEELLLNFGIDKYTIKREKEYCSRWLRDPRPIPEERRDGKNTWIQKLKYIDVIDSVRYVVHLTTGLSSNINYALDGYASDFGTIDEIKELIDRKNIEEYIIKLFMMDSLEEGYEERYASKYTSYIDYKEKRDWFNSKIKIEIEKRYGIRDLIDEEDVGKLLDKIPDFQKTKPSEEELINFIKENAKEIIDKIAETTKLALDNRISRENREQRRKEIIEMIESEYNKEENKEKKEKELLEMLKPEYNKEEDIEILDENPGKKI